MEKTVAWARKPLKQGKHDQARELLDAGYQIAKAAVERVRDGKTLVRSLKFETKEKEYRYELDRNDTHQMPVKVLLDEKKPSAQARAVVDKYVARAGELRSEAEEKANDGDFKSAILLLEPSTRESVRAIRGAGVYILG